MLLYKFQGGLSDVRGRRPIMIQVLGLATFSNVLLGIFSNSITGIFISRLLGGKYNEKDSRYIRTKCL